MTKADLIEEVSRVVELTRKDSEVIVETIFDSVVGSLKAGDKVEIRGFGSFRTRERKGRIGRNPKSGDRVEVPPKTMGLSARGGCGRLLYERIPHCEVKQFETLAGYRGRAVVLRLPCSETGDQVTNGIGIYKFEHVNPDAQLTAFFDEVFGPLDASSMAG